MDVDFMLEFKEKLYKLDRGTCVVDYNEGRLEVDLFLKKPVQFLQPPGYPLGYLDSIKLHIPIKFAGTLPKIAKGLQEVEKREKEHLS